MQPCGTRGASSNPHLVSNFGDGVPPPCDDLAFPDLLYLHDSNDVTIPKMDTIRIEVCIIQQTGAAGCPWGWLQSPCGVFKPQNPLIKIHSCASDHTDTGYLLPIHLALDFGIQQVLLVFLLRGAFKGKTLHWYAWS